MLEDRVPQIAHPVWRAFFLVRIADYTSLRLFRRPLRLLDDAETLILDRISDARYHDYLGALLCHVYGSRGEVYRHWGLLDLADHWYRRERKQIELLSAEGQAVENERRLAHIHAVRMAGARNDVLELEAAIGAALAEEELFDAAPRDRAKLLLRYGDGLIEAERRDPDRERRSTAVLRGALEQLAATYGDPQAVPPAERVLPELNLAEAAWSAGDPAEARSRLERASRLVERMGGVEANEYTLWVALSARFEGEDRQRWRAPLLEAYERQLVRWRTTEARAGGYGFLQFHPTRALLSELILLELERTGGEEGERAALEVLLRSQGVGSLDRRLGAPTPTLARVQRQLCAEGRGVLLYLPGPVRSHLFLVDGREVQHVQVPSADAIDVVRHELVSSLGQPAGEVPEGALRDLLRRRQTRRLAELSTSLLPDEVHERIARWSEVRIVGDDLLGGVPFEALSVGEHPYLGTWKPVSRLPSLALGLLWVDSAPPAARREVWLLAAPVNPDFGPFELGAGGAAWEALVADWPRARRRVVVGKDARQSLLFGSEFARAAVLQVFAHGELDLTLERPAALVLSPEGEADDGRLRTGEIDPEDGVRGVSAPPVVLLTACRAGVGPERRGGAGAVDLGGAFLARGARAVVLTPFELEERAGLHLTRTMHAALAEGATTAEAARRARAELAAREGFEDPFYHALLQVVGDGSTRVPRDE